MPLQDVPGLTRIAQVYSTTQAALTISALEGAGISVTIPGLHTLNTVPHWAMAMGGLPVLTPTREADEARALLNHIDAAPGTSSTEPHQPAAPSPWAKALMAVVYLLTGTAPAWHARIHSDQSVSRKTLTK